MDSERRTGKRSLPFVILRWSLALLFPILSFFVLSFIVGLVAVLLADSPVTSPISVPSQCKIVSTSVDLRSSKVCELGLFNYKAKHVFYPFEKSKFRCRYDYYWASIFQVEYKDLSSGVTQLALAEAPNEALPLNCRPNFGAAWLNKDKFKVNETYDCWYTYGIPKVSLHDDGFFSCQAKDPSTFEMIKRYFLLPAVSFNKKRCLFLGLAGSQGGFICHLSLAAFFFVKTPSTKIIHSWLLSKNKPKYWRWEVVAGVIAGFSTSMISISCIMLLQQMKSSLPGFAAVRLVVRAFLRVLFSRVCFLLVYLSVVGWLALQYGNRLGLLEIFTAFNN
ncbi:exopolysaccharide production negative regulator [Parasponia andersonii]|uniref:Exopolysaccharide production negative regulator n=1 Tax=Parasponia andersonii TaxID=3476 RepID=A0A2P5B7L4_PARAD|nr:exopolysaccharide production negative regulator [Parasponia andersonii]